MTRSLGKSGPTVASIGLGATGMSDLYGPADRTENIATIRAALDAGVNLIDTGDFYGSGHNEMLIREALAGISREDFLLSVKFGALRDPSGGWAGIQQARRISKTICISGHWSKARAGEEDFRGTSPLSRVKISIRI